MDYDGRHFKLTGASIAPLPVQPDLPMWIGGSSEAAVRRTAKCGTGWQAGAETPATVGQVIADIKTAVEAAGRGHIDDDHYGAALAYRFGGPDDPGVARVMEEYKTRTGRDARSFSRWVTLRWSPPGLLNMSRSALASSFCVRRRKGGCRYVSANETADRGSFADRRLALAKAGEETGGGVSGA